MPRARKSADQQLTSNLLFPPRKHSRFLSHCSGQRESSGGALGPTQQLRASLLRCLQQRQPPSATLSTSDKLNICQQVSQAMAYLHERNIVHGKLTSVNIYIEPNRSVKISLIDNETCALVADAATAHNTHNPCEPTEQRRRSNCAGAHFNLPALTYLSPELITSIAVCEHAQPRMDISRLSKMSDMFAFGTLLYELFEQRFPFGDACDDGTCCSDAPLDWPHPLGFARRANSAKSRCTGNIKLSASELIYQIGSGQMHRNLQHTAAPQRGTAHEYVREVIASCWNTNPQLRPQFKHLKFE